MKWSEKHSRNRWILEEGEEIPSPSGLDYIVTGIPRSGTSLMSTILSLSEDSFCFNEIHYKVTTLPSFFLEMRNRIDAGLPVVNKINHKGKLTSDTQRQDGIKYSEMYVSGKKNPVKLGSKVNVPYLNSIEQITELGYKIVAMIRAPDFTLASWNDVKVSNIPEANVIGPSQHKRWDMFSFSNESKLERQLIIWEYYEHIINSLSSNTLIVNYESLLKNPTETISNVCNFLGINPPRTIPELIDGNSLSKYPLINEIRDHINR